MSQRLTGAEGRAWVGRMALRDDWLAKAREEIVDPEREIVDPHHHLWARGGAVYGLDELRADAESGHKVVQTVFIECRAFYREDGPEHLRPVGETEHVAAIAARAAESPGRPQIAGIVAHADLRGAHLDEVLDAHEAAGAGRFRGIRHSAARDPEPEALSIPGLFPAGLYEDDAFRAGVARLGERGLTYDAWHYHHQNADFRDLAAAVPGTTLVLDHFGTPLGVGRFEGRRDEIFAAWKDEIAAIAELPNVVAKLGGLAMPDNGWDWHARETPPGSDEIAETQGPWHRHAIACFGPERCMFESNFPVDRVSTSYAVFWNAFKKIAADYDEAAREAMFSGTARRVYGL